MKKTRKRTAEKILFLLWIVAFAWLLDGQPCTVGTPTTKALPSGSLVPLGMASAPNGTVYDLTGQTITAWNTSNPGNPGVSSNLSFSGIPHAQENYQWLGAPFGVTNDRAVSTWNAGNSWAGNFVVEHGAAFGGAAAIPTTIGQSAPTTAVSTSGGEYAYTATRAGVFETAISALFGKPSAGQPWHFSAAVFAVSWIDHDSQGHAKPAIIKTVGGPTSYLLAYFDGGFHAAVVNPDGTLSPITHALTMPGVVDFDALYLPGSYTLSVFFAKSNGTGGKARVTSGGVLSYDGDMWLPAGASKIRAVISPVGRPLLAVMAANGITLLHLSGGAIVAAIVPHDQMQLLPVFAFRVVGRTAYAYTLASSGVNVLKTTPVSLGCIQ